MESNTVKAILLLIGFIEDKDEYKSIVWILDAPLNKYSWLICRDKNSYSFKPDRTKGYKHFNASNIHELLESLV